jgi:hypothetical protein
MQIVDRIASEKEIFRFLEKAVVWLVKSQGVSDKAFKQLKKESLIVVESWIIKLPSD